MKKVFIVFNYLFSFFSTAAKGTGADGKGNRNVRQRPRRKSTMIMMMMLDDVITYLFPEEHDEAAGIAFDESRQG